MGSIRTRLEADLAAAEAKIAELKSQTESVVEELRLATEHRDYIAGLIAELGETKAPRRAATVPDFKARIIAALGEPGKLCDIGTVLAALKAEGLDVSHQRVRTALGRMVKDGAVTRSGRGLYSAARSA